jgi:hypothetical protein
MGTVQCENSMRTCVRDPNWCTQSSDLAGIPPKYLAQRIADPLYLHDRSLQPREGQNAKMLCILFSREESILYFCKYFKVVDRFY